MEERSFRIIVRGVAHDDVVNHGDIQFCGIVSHIDNTFQIGIVHDRIVDQCQRKIFAGMLKAEKPSVISDILRNRTVDEYTFHVTGVSAEDGSRTLLGTACISPEERIIHNDSARSADRSAHAVFGTVRNKFRIVDLAGCSDENPAAARSVVGNDGNIGHRQVVEISAAAGTAGRITIRQRHIRENGAF